MMGEGRRVFFFLGGNLTDTLPSSFHSQRTDNSSVCNCEALWRTLLCLCFPSAAVALHTAFLSAPFTYPDITILNNSTVILSLLFFLPLWPQEKYKMAAQVRQWHQMTWQNGRISKETSLQKKRASQATLAWRHPPWAFQALEFTCIPELIHRIIGGVH